MTDRRSARFVLALGLIVAALPSGACSGLAPKPAEVAPEARRALEQACRADAAAVEAGLKKPTPAVDEACEVVRAACVD